MVCMQAAERVLAQQEQLQEQLQQAKAARLDAKLEQVIYDLFFYFMHAPAM